MKRFLLGLSFLIAFACASGRLVPIPIPTGPPPTSADHTVGVTVRDERGDGAGFAVATLHADGDPHPTCQNDGGRVTCHTSAVGGAHLDVEAVGYQSVETDRFNIGDVLPEIHLRLARVDLPRVIPRDRRQLGLSSGEPWAAVEATDFNLLGKVADGIDIEPVLAQRAHPDGNPGTPGFNLLRVFTAYDICPTGNCPPGNQPIGRLVPHEHPDLYDVLIPRLADQASRQGLYLELVAFTGPYGSTLPSDNDKVFHWLNLCGAARSRPNIVLELVNEYDNQANRGIPFAQLPDCDGVLTSHGSATEDGTPVTPVWRAATFHPGAGLSGEWQRRPGHDAMDMSTALGVAVWVNEQGRFTDQVSNCAYAYAVARSLTLLAAGGDYHSVHGKNSSLWSGVELECAIQFAAGARAVPWDCKDSGGYTHAISEEGDAWLRVFRWGPRLECVVFIPK